MIETAQKQAIQLPLTVSVAEVFSCPHTHEYSPVSATDRPWICSSHTAPSCLRPYLSPSRKVFVPFFHVTGATLLSSQLSVAVVPSMASSLFRASVNLAGRAGEVRKIQTQSHTLRTRKTLGMDGTGKTGSPWLHRQGMLSTSLGLDSAAHGHNLVYASHRPPIAHEFGLWGGGQHKDHRDHGECWRQDVMLNRETHFGDCKE